MTRIKFTESIEYTVDVDLSLIPNSIDKDDPKQVLDYLYWHGRLDFSKGSEPVVTNATYVEDPFQ